MAPGINLPIVVGDVHARSNAAAPTKEVQINVAEIDEPETVVTDGTNIQDPATVTQDFHELQFEAAALRQLDNPPSSKPTSTQLISSPYNNPGHYLDLTTLDTANLIFAKALTALKPINPNYATAPYIASLDFGTVLALVRLFSQQLNHTWTSTAFYVVIFRSKLKENIDNDLLYKLDYESHREACESGGLLKYWFGKPTDERRNLATCE